MLLKPDYTIASNSKNLVNLVDVFWIDQPGTLVTKLPGDLPLTCHSSGCRLLYSGQKRVRYVFISLCVQSTTLSVAIAWVLVQSRSGISEFGGPSPLPRRGGLCGHTHRTRLFSPSFVLLTSTLVIYLQGAFVHSRTTGAAE